MADTGPVSTGGSDPTWRVGVLFSIAADGSFEMMWQAHAAIKPVFIVEVASMILNASDVLDGMGPINR